MANTTVSKLYDHYDYIHYSAENADFTAVEAMAKLSKTKDAIIKRYGKAVLKKREETYISKLPANVRKELESWLTGKAFEGMSKSEVAIESQPYDLKDFCSLEEAIERAGKNVDSTLDSIGNFCNQVEKNIMEYLSSQGLQNMRKKYDAYLMKNFLNNDFSVAQGEYATQLLQALLSRANDGLFHKIPQTEEKGNEEVLETSVAKLIALANALPEAKVTSSTVKFSNGKTAYAKNESEVMKQIIRKYQGWVDQLNALAAEEGVYIAVLSGNEKALKELEKTDNYWKMTGSKNYTVDWVPDSQQEKLLAQTKNGLQRATGYKISKADTAVQYMASDGSIIASMGLSIKEIKDKKGVGIENMKSADIRLQHSTPLLTLLMREGGMSGTDMNEIYNLVSVHGDSGSLNALWDNVIEYLKYRTLLNALMGINTAEQSFFMVLNGKFLRMSDIIDHIIKNDAGKVSWSGEMADSSVKGSGLTRTPYVRRNWWQPPRHSNPYSALKRSAKQQQTVSSIMYATKITVNLRLTELATLMKMAK